jgi:hypothetical protein
MEGGGGQALLLLFLVPQAFLLANRTSHLPPIPPLPTHLPPLPLVQGGQVDWVRVGLAVSCASLAALLYRALGANAVLASRLGRREAELADLVSERLQLRPQNEPRTTRFSSHPTQQAACLFAFCLIDGV